MVPVLFTVVLSACQSDKGEQATAPVAPAPVEQVEPSPAPEPTPAYTAPLTGEAQAVGDESRPIAVMINNAPAARPQSGLSEADMVYEVLAEGGITRLIAVYQSYHGEATIGPVRSIRPYLIGIGDSLHALLVHAGGSPDAYAILQHGGREHLDEITNAGAPFWRDSSRKAPHNLYTNEVKLRETALKKGYADKVKIPSFPFLSVTTDQVNTSETATSGTIGDSETGNSDATDTSTSDGIDSTNSTMTDNTSAASTESAKKIELRFLLQSYKVGYIYDQATDLYTRQINDKDHIDLNNKKPLTAANVVVLSGSYKVLDDVGRLSLKLDSGGEALLFQQGKVIRGEWKHGSDDAIRFYREGKEIPFVRGTTYYNIVPNTPTFDEHLTIDGEKWD